VWTEGRSRPLPDRPGDNRYTQLWLDYSGCDSFTARRLLSNRTIVRPWRPELSKTVQRSTWTCASRCGGGRVSGDGQGEVADADELLELLSSIRPGSGRRGVKSVRQVWQALAGCAHSHVEWSTWTLIVRRSCQRGRSFDVEPLSNARIRSLPMLRAAGRAPVRSPGAAFLPRPADVNPSTATTWRAAPTCWNPRMDRVGHRRPA
jgi:hypothetical protein